MSFVSRRVGTTDVIFRQSTQLGDEATDPVVLTGFLRKDNLTIIDANRILANVTANVSILNSGTLPVVRGGTGLSAVGTAGQVLTTSGGSIIWQTPSPGITDHGLLTGLGNDNHGQYAILAGRLGGQTLIGGIGPANNLRLRGTSNITPGDVIAESNIDATGFSVFAGTTAMSNAGFSGVGSLLTALNATALTTGTVSDARLPTTLAGKTLTAPTIADFTNAGHNHQNVVGGATLDAVAIASGSLADARYPNAVLRDGSRTLLGALTPNVTGATNLGTTLLLFGTVYSNAFLGGGANTVIASPADIVIDPANGIVAPLAADTGTIDIGVATRLFRHLGLSGDANIGGVLNHDGTTAGFYGAVPTIQATASVSLTGTAGGIADGSIEAIPDPADLPASADALRDDLVATTLPAIRNDLDELRVKVNKALDVIRAVGLMAA